MVSRSGGPAPLAAGDGPDRYRPELQGLRALAVALVVVHQVWPDRVFGGVGVFFVVSGFLVTASLLRATAGSRIELGRVYGRAITRLFPVALTVLAVTMVVSVVVLPENRWFRTIREVVAAALYVENWQLATDPADQVAQPRGAGVVQHFWAQSVLGQFHLVWPLLVAAMVIAARRGPRRPLSWCLAIVFAGSLAYSVALTAAHRPLATVDSLARAWEFALGGLLAVGIGAAAPPLWSRIILGWAGVVALIAGGLLLPMDNAYLGPWPAVAGAAVIAGAGGRLGVDRLLGVRPLVYLGNLSYALYLWHWPVLVLYLVARERSDLGLRGGAVVIGTSVLLSVLTYHLIQRPVATSRIGVASRWGAYRFAALVLTPVLAGAGYWHLVSTHKAAAYASTVADVDHPGALARTPGFEYWGADDAAVIPPLTALPSDYAPIAANTCKTSERNQELSICTTRAAEPTMRVMVVGDSHLQQFLAALDPIAQRRGWQVASVLKGGCEFSEFSEFSAGADPTAGNPSCVRWNADAMREILARRPHVVFVNGTRDVRVGLTEQTPAGFVAAWRTLADVGIRVLALRDNPRYDFSPPVCVAIHGPTAARCGTPRAELLGQDPPYARVRDLPSTVSFLDFSDYLCTGTTCPPVIGNVHVYLDENHLSATYVRTMTPIVEQAIDTALAR